MLKIKEIASCLAMTMLLCILLVGCKTVKETSKTREKTEFSQQNDVKETTVTKVKEKTTEKTNAQTNENEQTVEESTTVEFSMPDSSGKQHVTKITTKTKGSQTNKATNTNISKAAETNIESNTNKEDKSKLKGKTDIARETEKETKKPTPGWVILGTIILSIGLLVILYFVLKQFKIVK